MSDLLINIDVPDVEKGSAFYTAALGLRIGRRFGESFVELCGANALIYLLEKKVGSSIGPSGGDRRRYNRHWTPVHFDVVVENLSDAVMQATNAGAIPEGGITDTPYGKLAMFADPFGHGFCLIEFNEEGYDAIANTPELG